MIAVQLILIATGALLADAHECNCDCGGSQTVCEVQAALHTEVDENKEEIAKWNEHYDFIKSFAEDWENQVAQVVRNQLVGVNETIEGVKNDFEASRKDVDTQLERQMARIESLENSLWTQNKRVDKLDANMQNISDQMSAIKTECQCPGIKAVCDPPCQNGGECVENNLCDCSPSFTGDICQQEVEPKCGTVDNNARENAGSDFVWPWMAAVYKNGNEYGCDGSIINRNFVLTSAWCMTYFGSEGLSVKLGLSDLQKGTYLQEHEVKEVITHSWFKGGRRQGDNHDYDIALLELKEPIQFGPFVRPICLPPTETSEDGPFYEPESIARAVALQDYIAAASTSQDAAPMLLNLTILPLAECRRKLREAKLERIHPNQDLSFCAESSTDKCPREGSPVQQSRLEEDGARTWTQVGIRSWNVKCELFFIPRLDRLRSWVENIIET